MTTPTSPEIFTVADEHRLSADLCLAASEPLRQAIVDSPTSVKAVGTHRYGVYDTKDEMIRGLPDDRAVLEVVGEMVEILQPQNRQVMLKALLQSARFSGSFHADAYQGSRLVTSLKGQKGTLEIGGLRGDNRAPYTAIGWIPLRVGRLVRIENPALMAERRLHRFVNNGEERVGLVIGDEVLPRSMS